MDSFVGSPLQWLTMNIITATSLVKKYRESYAVMQLYSYAEAVITAKERSLTLVLFIRSPHISATRRGSLNMRVRFTMRSAVAQKKSSNGSSCTLLSTLLMFQLKSYLSILNLTGIYGDSCTFLKSNQKRHLPPTELSPMATTPPSVVQILVLSKATLVTFCLLEKAHHEMPCSTSTILKWLMSSQTSG